MHLEKNIINDIKKEIGEIRTKKAEEAIRDERVKIESIDLNWDYEIVTLRASVLDEYSKVNRVLLRLNLEMGGVIYAHDCSCHPYSYKNCEHILAVLIEFTENPKYFIKIQETIAEERKKEERMMFNYIIEKFKYDEDSFEDISDVEENVQSGILKTNIEIVPQLKQNKRGEYELSFKVGEDKMYKIKSLEEFYKNYLNGGVFRYGEHLTFEHKEEVFNKNSKDFLNFILKYGQAIYFGNMALENKNSYNSKIPSSNLLLNEEVLEDFFEILKNKNYTIEIDGKKKNLNFMQREGNIKFVLEETDEEKYRLSLNKADIKILKGMTKIYTICDNNVYEYDKKKYNDVFKLVAMFEYREKTEFNFEKDELIEFVNNILPRIRDNVSFDSLSNEVIETYIPKKLAVKVYLDLTQKGDVLATVKYCYDNVEFEPLSSKIPTIPRDLVFEKKVIKRFMQDGFSYSRNYESFIMKEEEQIYNFITNSINYYLQNFEVLISEDFKKREIRQPKIASLGVRIQNNLLNIDLSGLDFEPDELKSILEKYKLKKKYHRLKNGEFLSLESNADLEFIEDLTEGVGVDFNSLSKGRIKIPVNRSLYLNKLLGNIENVEISEDKEFRDIIISTENGKIDEDIIIPQELEDTLRTYQKTGYKWLKVLDKYRFGGILADDMGLRKNFASNCCFIGVSK